MVFHFSRYEKALYDSFGFRSRNHNPFKDHGSNSGRYIPSATFTPVITQTPSILITSQPTLVKVPTLTATKSLPCEVDYVCVVSNDGKWAADWHGQMLGISTKGQPFIRIYKGDGTLVHTIVFKELDSTGRQLMYYPIQFSSDNQWLFAKVRRDSLIDSPMAILPTILGFVKINVDTGQLIPMVGYGSYYSVGFSPDESQFVYTMDQALGILDLKSDSRKLIALKYRAATYIQWKSDGTSFLMAGSISCLYENAWDILMITPDDSHPVQIVGSFKGYSDAVKFIENKTW